ncbi:uncharacterized protein TNCV_3412391 [Trichonephila clavipes]|uniref:Uncharacterized protein n=1 Tax=Trichonephila clavipes TaxID=2585209 RepID=A0A8X6RLR5_TRICX|nr:uncharacterized protein TNCV_3412391 [Trichonephila clavipes]
MRERERRGSGAFLCSCTGLAGYGIPQPLNRAFCSMASTFARSYTVVFFPMGPSQGTGASRYVVTTQMDLVARLYATCTSVDPAALRLVMTAIPRCAQACLDMHGGHFDHLP